MSGYGTNEYADTLFNGGVSGSLSLVDTDGAVLANVSGGANLPDRQLVILSPITGDIYFGFENTVTSSTGVLLCKGQTLGISLADCVDLYVVTNSTTPVDVRIAEVG